MSTGASYPVRLDLDAPLEVARWRPLVAWLLAIPHFVVLYALQMVMSVIAFIAWFAILFTGQFPRGMFDVATMCQRYMWRATSYAMWLREPYPPFEFGSTAEDPGTDPATFSIDYPEKLSRGLIFVKWLLLIPHIFVLLFVGLAAGFVMFVGFFAVLFTGKWPEGMRRFLVGYQRWYMRVGAYALLMTDVYPPFSLD